MCIVKKFTLHLMVIVMLMCAFAFPSLGEVAAAEAAEFTLNEEISGIKKDSNGQVVYTKTFYADNTVNLKVLAEHLSYDFQDYNFALELYGPNGELVAPTSGDSYIGEKLWESSKFNTAGDYTLQLTCGYTGLGTAGYKLTIELKKDKVWAYKFDKISASNYGDPNNPDNVSKKPEIKILVGDFEAPNGTKDNIDVAIYRVTGDNKISALKNISDYKTTSIYDKNLAYSTKYTYYIVDKGYVPDTVKATLDTIGTKAIKLTDAIKKALSDPHVTKSATVKTKAYPVAPVTNLKVYAKGVRWVELTWARGVGYVDGYVLKSYDSEGVLRQTKTVNELGYGGSKIYIAYAGKSKVTVTPYALLNDKKVYGKAVTIKGLTSEKMKAPSGNVTKITNSKASITVSKSQDVKGIQIQQKKGSKWVAVAKSTSQTIKKNWTKNSAGKSSYRMRAYLVDKNGKTYYSAWKTFKPKANQRTYTKWSVDYLRDLYGANTYWYPDKISYSDGKLKVVGRFSNTWLYASASCKVKVTFKVDGKVIGTQTISSGKIGAYSSKTKTVYLNNSVSGKDLYRVTYSVKYLAR